MAQSGRRAFSPGGKSERIDVNEFREGLQGTPARTASERDINRLRQGGGVFVAAVRVTRMPMIVTNPTLEGNPIVFANPAFCQLSGYEPEEILGQSPIFMVGPDTSPDAIKEFHSCLNERRDVTVEILQYRKGGSAFWATVFATLLYDDQNHHAYQFLSYLDVTRRRQTEQELRAFATELESRVAKRTSELEAANAALRKADAEREVLLVEINHRAKNSLAVAASLLELQGRSQPDPAVEVLFNESANRLKSMARLHDLLSRSNEGQRIDLADYVPEICESLRPLVIAAGGDRISLSSRTEEHILVDADQAFPIGIVVTELITNAVKYAFPDGRLGNVVVTAARNNPERVTIVVSDDGVGMKDIRQGSLGYRLVHSLVDQIGGQLDVRTEAGVTVTISYAT